VIDIKEDSIGTRLGLDWERRRGAVSNDGASSHTPGSFSLGVLHIFFESVSLGKDRPNAMASKPNGMEDKEKRVSEACKFHRGGEEKLCPWLAL
jgi:hypothetical protein